MAQLRRQIKDEIIAKIEEARQTGGLLEEIKHIAYGNSSTVSMVDSMPSLWIVPNAHVPDLRGGHTAGHDYSFDFVVMVYNLDAQIGSEKAEDLAATVYDVINEMRRSDAFYDVRPSMVAPVAVAVTGKAVFWSSVEFVFRVQRRE